MTGVRRSFLLSLADSYLALVLQVASTVIISRLLSPAEVGVFAIAAVFMALASMFRDFGVAEYLIQERELTEDRIRATLALNIAVSWLMAAALAAAAPLAAVFYREPGVREVMWVQSLSLCVVPFGAVTMAWFRRQLNYGPIVIANAISAVVAFAVSVGLAFAGFGYMSLAWGGFAGVLTAVLVIAFFRPRELPRWPGLREIGHVFHFGKFASAMYIVAQAGKGAPELIIGRARDAASVGIFSRANGLVEMFNRLILRPVLSICLPYFAQSERDKGSLVPAYLSSVSMLAAVGWPFMAVLAIAAFAAIRLMYGPQWLAAVPLAQVLCLAAAIDLVHTLSREALVARGDVRRASGLQLALVVVQVACLLVGIQFGLAGAAWGMAVAALVGAVLSQRALKRSVGLRTGALLQALGKPALLTAWTALPLLALAQFWPASEANFWAWGMVAAASVSVLWLSGLRLLGHPLWQELLRVAQGLRARLPGARPIG